MATPANLPPTPASTGGWSLFELRRHLVQEAATLIVQARCEQGKGQTARAARMVEESHRLRQAARTMFENEPPAQRGS